METRLWLNQIIPISGTNCNPELPSKMCKELSIPFPLTCCSLWLGFSGHSSVPKAKVGPSDIEEKSVMTAHLLCSRLWGNCDISHEGCWKLTA